MAKGNINTVEKGNRFEKKSRDIIIRALEEGSLGIKDFVKIKEKPSYYSADRKGNITFDLSIEVWPPNATRFVLLYLIECKDYSKAIPVDDLEEFYSKVMQVAEGCAKAVFIANNVYQSGAYNFAESKRMMLIRAEEGTSHHIILHKKIGSFSDIPPLTKIGNIDLRGSELLCKNIEENLESAFKKADKSKEIELHHNLRDLSKEEIAAITEKILYDVNPDVFKDGVPLYASKLENYIKSIGIELVHVPGHSDFYGQSDLANNKISINSKILNTSSYSFVLAHELGHFILHKNLIVDQMVYDNFPDPKKNFSSFKFTPLNPENYDFSHLKHWIEWQANHFAETLILPRFALTAKLWYYQEEYGMRTGKLFLTSHDSSNDMANKIIHRLARYYNIPPSAVILRLVELNLLEEYTNVKSIAELLPEYIDSYL